MDARALPAPIRAAIEQILAGRKLDALRRAAAALSARYRHGDPGRAPFIGSDDDVDAYLAARTPATYAAVRSVFEELAVRMRDFAPRSALDVRCGPGTSAWAAVEQWPLITRVDLLERDRRFIAVGREIAARSGLVTGDIDLRWRRAEIGTDSWR